MTVTLVAAVARNGVIGRDGDIPWRLPGEQRRFKEVTLGHVLVMGRRTYDSIGRPLPGRTTVVVTRQPGWRPADGADVLVATTVDDALARASEVDDEVYVAGGSQIYAEALAHADRLLLTLVDAAPEGDTVFPPVDWNQWAEVTRESHDGWSLVTYERVGG
ncbi:MAG: dihydrofolate reductase [Nocardioidaceae bacterium]